MRQGDRSLMSWLCPAPAKYPGCGAARAASAKPPRHERDLFRDRRSSCLFLAEIRDILRLIILNSRRDYYSAVFRGQGLLGAEFTGLITTIVIAHEEGGARPISGPRILKNCARLLVSKTRGL